jgi:D-alanyl-D-alanine carboxypeptidase
MVTANNQNVITNVSGLNPEDAAYSEEQVTKALLALLALSMGINVDSQSQTSSQTQTQPQTQQRSNPSLMDILMSFINPAAQSQTQNGESPSSAPADPNRQVIEPKLTNDPSKPYSAVCNDKGEIIAGNMVEAKCDPASTVKSMTLLTLAQLQKEGKLPKDFISKNSDLVAAMCANSDNGAANELAKRAGKELGGDAQKFVDEMNRVGKDVVGLKASRFTNASGYPLQNANGVSDSNADMYSTAGDMAKFEWFLNKNFPDVAKQYAATAKSTTGASQFADKGVDVGKTGTARGTSGRPEGERSFIGGLEGGGSIAIAEVSKAEWAAQINNLANLARGIQHADVRTNYAPLETPMLAASSNQRTV